MVKQEAAVLLLERHRHKTHRLRAVVEIAEEFKAMIEAAHEQQEALVVHRKALVLTQAVSVRDVLEVDVLAENTTENTVLIVFRREQARRAKMTLNRRRDSVQIHSVAHQHKYFLVLLIFRGVLVAVAIVDITTRRRHHQHAALGWKYLIYQAFVRAKCFHELILLAEIEPRIDININCQLLVHKQFLLYEGQRFRTRRGLASANRQHVNVFTDIQIQRLDTGHQGGDISTYVLCPCERCRRLLLVERRHRGDRLSNQLRPVLNPVGLDRRYLVLMICRILEGCNTLNGDAGSDSIAYRAGGHGREIAARHDRGGEGACGCAGANPSGRFRITIALGAVTLAI